jgi:hypothetical protein
MWRLGLSDVVAESRNAYMYIASAALSALAFSSADSLDSLGFDATWLPGLAFGFLFGLLHFGTSDLIIAYSVISAATFVVASKIAASLYPIFAVNKRWNRPRTLFAGLVAGGFGALVLAATFNLFRTVDIDLEDDGLTILIGAAAGAFMLLTASVNPTRPVNRLLWTTLWFTLWQLPVGLMLALTIRGRVSTASAGFSIHFRAFLLGPTVQLIGLIGSALAIISYVRREKGRRA